MCRLKPWAAKKAIVALACMLSKSIWLMDVILREYLIAGM
jgi:hypothetical protein